MTQVMLKAPPPMPAPPPAGPRLAPGADGGWRAAPALGEDWLSLHFGRALRRRHARGAHLFLEGAETENLYFFLRGWAMKYKSLLDGRRQILDFVLPGEPLGFVAAQRAPYAVEMLCDAETVAVPRRAFDEAFGADPGFARAICRQLEAASTRAHDRMTSIGCRSARTRVCRLLAELVERTLGELPAHGPVSIALPLSQRHIADATALRVETVCRALVQLAEEGVAVVRRGTLRVADPAMLADEA
ncbi:MAG: Crp/Fnr family transcriptional regulator [Alphaproteobacteria bacterium]